MSAVGPELGAPGGAIRIAIDGVPLPTNNGSGLIPDMVNPQLGVANSQGTAIVQSVPLAPGPHRIAIEWRGNLGTSLLLNPAADNQMATLLVRPTDVTVLPPA